MCNLFYSKILLCVFNFKFYFFNLKQNMYLYFYLRNSVCSSVYEVPQRFGRINCLVLCNIAKTVDILRHILNLRPASQIWPSLIFCLIPKAIQYFKYKMFSFCHCT